MASIISDHSPSAKKALLRNLNTHMEAWFIPLVSLPLGMLIIYVFSLLLLLPLLFSVNNKTHLPPGPLHIPIITNILWLLKPFSKLEPILLRLHAKYGPIITLHFFSIPSISVADRSLAHQALIQNGAIFSDRPKSLLSNSNQLKITTSLYGPTWRLLRRNLASEMLHPSRIKSFSGIRKWVLQVLLNRLKFDSESSNSVRVMDRIRHAMFCLLVFMCFGERVDDVQVQNLEDVQRRLLSSFTKFSILNFFPVIITRTLFRKRWEEFLQLRREQKDVLVPLIRARKQDKENRLSNARVEKENHNFNEPIISYLDTLLALQMSEEKRKLDETELVTLCSEFLNAGTDTTSTALQWIMANLVKHPHVQQRVVEEIGEAMGDRGEKEVKEEDLPKLSYLKAVILEGLRRHPPAHFTLPHAVTEDVVLDGYLVPKNGTVNFMVAEMGWNPQVWEDPMAFKPERFLTNEECGVEGFDITGRKEIKMMPFGAGRRICPGYNLAMLHLEYFVANLVWNFEWKGANGGDVDLSEKQEFTTVMKNALQAHISPRIYTRL